MHFAITMFVALLSVGVFATLSAYLSGEEQAVFAEAFDDGKVSVEVKKCELSTVSGSCSDKSGSQRAIVAMGDEVYENTV